MHLRNSRVALPLISLFLLTLAVAQDTAPPQGPPRSSQPAPSESPSPAPAPAQEAPQGQQPDLEPGGFVFHSDVQEVVLHATVIDDKQRIVTSLDKSAFTVFEDGKLQVIKSFRREDVPISLGIVVDNSGSMREKRAKVVKAALNLVRASNPQDEVFVVNFSDEYFLDQPFTSKINLLQTALEKYETRGGTALYDAVVASAEELKKHGKLQKKILFVVTDGEDDASRESLEQAVRILEAEPCKPFPNAPEGSHSSPEPSTKLTRSAARLLVTSATNTPSATNPLLQNPWADIAPSKWTHTPRDTASSL
jgi:Ca-activated chloride channel family protein